MKEEVSPIRCDVIVPFVIEKKKLRELRHLQIEVFIDLEYKRRIIDENCGVLKWKSVIRICSKRR